jgi:4-amino-4-deoxy-L-arabinose transferase-like glycosyltransferase
MTSALLDTRRFRGAAPVGPLPARLRGAVTPARLGLAALLLLTAAAYTWNLSASGYANSFYSAAALAATKSWKAFFFGSLDSSSFITVDKPPASLWVMALSGRIFGFSSWSMLLPQALEGVATTWLLYAAIRRWFGSPAGLLAGAVFAFTPVAALMFRFNNPDALLVLMLTAGAYCMTRALERAQTRWILAAGAIVGIAFLAKMLQAFLVLPAFSLVYLVAAPNSVSRRLWQLAVAGAALISTAGWWVMIVALWPAASRPFIDGSPDNSILNLITGYNGLERLFSGGGPGGGSPGAQFGGSTGLLRLFDGPMGGQASWLLPAALLALAVGLWIRRSAPRTDRTRAALILWGGWLLVTAIVFSLGRGVIHTYYTVALAPPIGALVAIGAKLLWQHRQATVTRLLAAAAVAVGAAWALVLLARTPAWEPWLRALVAVTGTLSVVVLLAGIARGHAGRRSITIALALGAIALAAGPLGYVVETIATPHTGSLPSAGPAATAEGGFAGGPPGGAGGPPVGTSRPPGGAGGPPRGGIAPTPGAIQTIPGGGPPSVGQAAAGPGSRGSSRLSRPLLSALARAASRYRWVAATLGSENAAAIELATGGAPVMAIGGFNGNGGNLSLSAFERYLRDGEIHYFIAGGGAGPVGQSNGESEITTWIAHHFRARSLGGQTVYDLTQAR